MKKLLIILILVLSPLVASAQAGQFIPFLRSTASTSTRATTTDFHISNLFNFGSVVGNTWDDFCTAITGGAGLCDGSDDGAGNSKWATSTDPAITPNGLGGIMVFSSSTISRLSVDFGTTTNATSTTFAVSSLTSALVQTNGNGTFAEYGGTSCTNQFVRVLSALGVGTCESVDISADTNLTAGDNLTLTGDDIDLDTTLTNMVAGTFSGLLTSGNLLVTGSSTLQNFTGVNSTTSSATTTSLFSTTASSTNLAVGGGTLSIFGTIGTALSDFCTAITGGAGLCDGTDASGSGGAAAVATSSAETATYVPFWTSTAGTPAELSGGESTFVYDSTLNKLTVSRLQTTDATSTNATSTNLDISGLFSLDGLYFDSLTDDATLDNSGGDLVVVDVNCTNCLTTTEVASADLATLATNVSDTDFGDVTVASGAWDVEDDSHAHTSTSISGLDISADTNLGATWPIVLSGDTVTWDGLATTSNPTAGNLFYSNGTRGLVPVATSSVTINSPLTSAGTAGYVVGGSGWTLDLDETASYTWTGAHIFNNITRSTSTQATSTNFFGGLFTANSLRVGQTATTSIESDGDLQVMGSTTLQNFTATNSTSSSATTTNFHISGNLNFNSVSGSTWASFCTSITGTSDLCDDDDVGGAASFGKTFDLVSGGDFLFATSSPLKSFGVGASTTPSLNKLALFQVNATSTTGHLIVASSTTGFSGNYLRFTDATGARVFSVESDGDLVVTGSTTLQRFTATHSTTTQATTTNFHVSGKGITTNGNMNFITGTTTKSFNIASTTMGVSGLGNGFKFGTTTLWLQTMAEASIARGVYCTASSSGAALLRFGDQAGNYTNNIVPTTNGTRTYEPLTTNNTWTAGEDFTVQASSTSGVVQRINCTIIFNTTAP